jgi:succinyl-diaminopimelate desuccinylase
MYTSDIMIRKKYTIQELSRKLHVSQRTLLREIQRGNLQTQRVGRRHLISEEDLNKYLEKGTSDLELKIKNFLKENKQKMVFLLQKMVSMYSGTNELWEEGRLAAFIKSFLEKNGIRSVLYKDEQTIAVRGSFGFADEGILLDCPLDTAPVGDLTKWKYPPFEGVIKEGRMYGRGTADCKAGIVSMIYAVLALKEFVNEEKIRIEMVFDGAEQSGEYSGMKLAIERGLPVEAGIIGYSGINDELAIGARGFHRYTFITHGESVHTGARYKMGVNAISKMVKFISAVEKAQLPHDGNKYFPFGQRLTFSMIEGGRVINVVPDECLSRIDIRTTPEVTKGKVDKFLSQIISQIQKEDKDFKIDWKYDVGQEGFLVNPKSKIISSLIDSIKDILKKEIPLTASGPANIGKLLYNHNIPVVIWGPKGEGVHSYNEYIEIDSLPLTSEIYTKTILNYFKVRE